MPEDMGAHYRAIGDNVYRFRMLQRMTQEELAARCDVTASYISQIERGSHYKGVTCTTLLQIAQALSVPVCLLLAEEPCDTYLEALRRVALPKPPTKVKA